MNNCILGDWDLDAKLMDYGCFIERQISKKIKREYPDKVPAEVMILTYFILREEIFLWLDKTRNVWHRFAENE
jgi:hypothetical protein